MNMSLQIGRSVFALGLLAVAGAGAFAQTGTDADAQAPNVAHNRLEILSSAQPQQTPRWVVASVRVGTPEHAQSAARPDAPRVAALVHAQQLPVPRS